MKKKIEKLDINLFSKAVSEGVYNKQKNEFIGNYKEYEVSFWGGGMKNRPDVGEAKWNSYYPNGYNSWVKDAQTLNAFGEQRIIDKINEIIDLLNKK